MQEFSPQKDYRTGIDGLLRESDPDGFTEVRTPPILISVLTVTQPLSLDEQYDNIEKGALRLLALIRSQRSHRTPEWLEKFNKESHRLYKFVDDNFRDETRRTLPKTNERDRRNQPLPANVIGRRFGTLSHDVYTAQ